jgi:hypothetical protein
VNAEVASKTGALEWAMRTLDATWRPLLGQVRDDRTLGFDPDARPRPGSARTRRESSRRTPRVGKHPPMTGMGDCTEAGPSLGVPGHAQVPSDGGLGAVAA